MTQDALNGQKDLFFSQREICINKWYNWIFIYTRINKKVNQETNLLIECNLIIHSSRNNIDTNRGTGTRIKWKNYPTLRIKKHNIINYKKYKRPSTTYY